MNDKKELTLWRIIFPHIILGIVCILYLLSVLYLYDLYERFPTADFTVGFSIGSIVGIIVVALRKLVKTFKKTKNYALLELISFMGMIFPLIGSKGEEYFFPFVLQASYHISIISFSIIFN
jgi:hypothetical protein